MDTQDLRHVAALLAAAFVSREHAKTPEDAAQLYFRCLDALMAADKRHDTSTEESVRQSLSAMHTPRMLPFHLKERVLYQCIVASHQLGSDA